MHTSSLADWRSELRRQILANEYPGYVYSYPHKKAYRTLEPGYSLRDVWEKEDRSGLFCYVHVPFCNQRCSFCNLFTFVPGDSSATEFYVDAVRQEAEQYAEVLGSCHYSRLYLGGGTPTYLSTRELRSLIGHLRATLGVIPEKTLGCIECSPETLDETKINTLAELGFQRVSLGVQSFDQGELHQVNRRFTKHVQEEAIRLIGRVGFPHFNIDLIYGLPGQNLNSWRQSLKRAIDTPATSLFLYPLYIRPLTGLGMRTSLDGPTPAQMAEMYDEALALLTRAGFRQLTMRQFRRDYSPNNPAVEYCCQRHGMMGLGAGARSYTTELHYATPWRMLTKNIRSVIDQYVHRMQKKDTTIRHGFVLNEEERRRRFVIQSLLYSGMDPLEFVETFGCSVEDVFGEEVTACREEGLLSPNELRLTPRGVRHADIVGQVFYSDSVRSLIATYEYDQ